MSQWYPGIYFKEVISQTFYQLGSISLCCHFAYRVSYHRAIKTSPFKALYGRDATLPSSVALELPTDRDIDLDSAFAQLMKVQLQASDALYRTKNQYSHTASTRAVVPSFSMHEDVLVYQARDSKLPGKLNPSWIGPASIISARGSEYSVKFPSGRVVNRIHGKYLKPYPGKNLGEGDVANPTITDSTITQND